MNVTASFETSFDGDFKKMRAKALGFARTIEPGLLGEDVEVAMRLDHHQQGAVTADAPCWAFVTVTFWGGL